MRKSLHSPDYTRLIRLLAATRRQSGITQQELADRLRKPQSFVAKVEGGERRIDVVEFVTIVRALKQDPSKVFSAYLSENQKDRRRALKT